MSGSILSKQAESPVPRLFGKIKQLSASPFSISSLDLNLAQFQFRFHLTAHTTHRRSPLHCQPEGAPGVANTMLCGLNTGVGQCDIEAYRRIVALG